MRRSFVVLGAWLAFLGCGGSTSESPATGDPKTDSDVASDVPTDGDRTDSETGAAACAPISGTAPFAVRLSGSGPITESYSDASGMVNASLDMYFPTGRVAGAEVVVVQRKFAGNSAVVRATLDSTLSARGLKVFDSDCADGVSGDLVGPAGGIVGVATNNLSAPSDALQTVKGNVVLCATGPVPAQMIVSQPPAKTTALELLAVRGARPFASTSFAAVTATTSSGAVALKVTDGDPGAFIEAATHFSWSTPTTVDLSGLRDVLGAPLGLGSFELQVPTAVVTDLSFATAIPAGAYVGTTPPTIDGGKLLVGSGSIWNSAIAIGAVTGKTSLRLRHRLRCDSGFSAPVGGWIVASDGKSVAVAPKCGMTAVDETATLPGPGPYTLLLTSPMYRPRPCNYPGGSGSPARYEADELAFE